MKTTNTGIAASSLVQMKQLRNIVTVGLLIAIGVIFNFFTITLTPFMRLNFKFLISSIAGMLYGPVAGAMYGGLSDILGYMVAPGGPYFIGFTLIAIINGVLNGYLYYQKEVTWKRVIIGRIIVVFICQVVLNTWCLSLLYSKYFWEIIPVRILKNALLLPLEIILLYPVLKMVHKIQKRL